MIYIIKSENLTIVYREIKTPSINQINQYFDYLEELVDRRKFNMIKDLSNTIPPSAEIRFELKKRYKAIDNLIDCHSV